MTKEERARKEAFSKKYDAAIRSIAVAEEKDMGIGEDMLKYEIRVRLGMSKREDFYKGIPDGFDWETAKADYLELIKK